MKKLLSLFVLLVAIVTGAQASTVSDLATLSTNRNVYFDDFMGGSALVAGTLYDSNYLFSVNNNNYASNKGTDKTINKLYCCRVKSTSQDVLAVKVGDACTLVIYADRITDRAPVLNTSVATSGDDLIEGTDVTATDGKKGYATYAIPAAGTYYIIGNGDCFLAGLEFTFAGAAKDYTVTAATNNSSYGTASAALSSLDEGETTEITAIAKAGYEFTSWAVEGEGATLSSTTDNPTTLTMGTANATVTATFTVVNNTITHNAATGGTYTISVDGGEATSSNTTATIGQTITLAGTPTVASFTDIAWNVKDASDNDVTVTDNQFTMPGSAVTITPVFSKPSLIKVTLTAGSSAATVDVTGTVGGTADVNVQSNTKLGSKGHYVGFTLASGTLQTGDIVEVKVSQAGGGKIIFYDDKNQTNTILDTEVTPTAGTHRFVLPEDADGQTSLYLVRGNSVNDGFNPYIAYVSVIRPDMTISLNASGFATFSYGSDFEYVGADAYGMALTSTSLTGTKVTSGSIKAGEGILFKGTANATVSIIETLDAEALTNNDLTGSTDANGDLVAKPTYCYALSGDTFKTFTGSTLTANKAFFGSDTAISTNSLELVFEDSEATAVEAVAEANANNAGVKKFFKNGQLVIETANGVFTAAGAQVK